MGNNCSAGEKGGSRKKIQTLSVCQLQHTVMECGLSSTLAHCGHMGSMESLDLVHLMFGNVLILPLLFFFFFYFLSQSNFPVRAAALPQL